VSHEVIKELESANPGSITDPKKYAAAFEIYRLAPERFKRIYGRAMRTIKMKKGLRAVGIFAHEVSLFPEKGLPKDIAFDLKAAHDFTLERGSVVKVLTGVRLNMPDGLYAMIKGRSGLSLRGIDILAGVIDPQYRGEIGVTLTRTYSEDQHDYQRLENGTIVNMGTSTDVTFSFAKGERIAQLIFVPHNIYVYPMYEIDKIPKSERGDRGYGSTGR
jgi:dUTP pyrophosphatase